MADLMEGDDRIAVIVLAIIVIVSIFSLVMLFTNGNTSGSYVMWDTFRHAEGGTYSGTSWDRHGVRTYVPTLRDELDENAVSAVHPPLSNYYR